MKILLVSNVYPSDEKPYGGVFIKNQYECLKSNKLLDVDIVCLKRTFTGKIRSVLKYLAFYFRAAKFLLKNYDVIHVHYFYYHFFFGVLYKTFHRGVKLVVTFHGSDTRNVEKKIFQWALSTADEIICVGKEQANYVCKFCGKVKVNTLCAGVDRSVFYKDPRIVEKKYNFTFVGSFLRGKGVDILIEAIRLFDNRNVTFCFIGSGPYYEDLVTLAVDYAVSIKLNLSQEQVRRVLNESRFLVLPSRSDAFGLVVTESMYCGTPVVVSNVNGLAEQVVDGYNGFILDEISAENLALMFQKLIGMDSVRYSRLVENCLHSGDSYSLERVCEELLCIYQKKGRGCE